MLRRFCARNEEHFKEFIQLCAASPQNSFWLVMMECFEECCTASEAQQEESSYEICIEAINAVNSLVNIHINIQKNVILLTLVEGND